MLSRLHKIFLSAAPGILYTVEKTVSEIFKHTRRPNILQQFNYIKSILDDKSCVNEVNN
jgi:hypothetical protein